ncbi:MAG: hypothetical protein JWM28_1677 [Chitinophagaceae bacterium]|nr:hypothetical protein [Chitinophagaceae bacterium]
MFKHQKQFLFVLTAIIDRNGANWQCKRLTFFQLFAFILKDVHECLTSKNSKNS